MKELIWKNLQLYLHQIFLISNYDTKKKEEIKQKFNIRQNYESSYFNN